MATRPNTGATSTSDGGVPEVSIKNEQPAVIAGVGAKIQGFSIVLEDADLSWWSCLTIGEKSQERPWFSPAAQVGSPEIGRVAT